MTISFYVPGKAATAGSKRAFLLRRRDRSFVTRKDGSPIINVTDDNVRSKDWKGDIRRCVSDEYSGPLLDMPLEVTLTFWLERPKFHLGKKGVKESAPKFPAKKPDVLKLARAVEDACTGLLWVDDAQIVTELLKKRYVSSPLVQPGVLIEVTIAGL